MKEFIEKLIGRLEEETYDMEICEEQFDMNSPYFMDVEYKMVKFDDVKEIVNQLAEEYSVSAENAHTDGWIPCSERLPEEHDSIFAKYKGTYKWNNAMFEKISDTVNVTVADENGNSETTYAHTVDGKWNCELLKCNKTYRIIAWRPLPEPYKVGEAE